MKQSDTRFKARLVLLLAVIQIMLVALEVSGWAHADTSEAYHHDNLHLETRGEPQVNDEMGKDVIDSSNFASDACDQCHHCSGHGSHLAAISGSSHLPTELVAVHPLSDQPDPQSIIIHSIHRPPIT
jgi:hypothetical protein